MAVVIQCNIAEILYVALNHSSFDLWSLKAQGPLLWLVDLFDLISVWGHVWGLGKNQYTFHTRTVRNYIYFWNATFFNGEWGNLHGNWTLPKLCHMIITVWLYVFYHHNSIHMNFFLTLQGHSSCPAEITEAFQNVQYQPWTLHHFTGIYCKLFLIFLSLPKNNTRES